jgi:hypothetical protein
MLEASSFRGLRYVHCPWTGALFAFEPASGEPNVRVWVCKHGVQESLLSYGLLDKTSALVAGVCCLICMRCFITGPACITAVPKRVHSHVNLGILRVLRMSSEEETSSWNLSALLIRRNGRIL